MSITKPRMANDSWRQILALDGIHSKLTRTAIESSTEDLTPTANMEIVHIPLGVDEAEEIKSAIEKRTLELKNKMAENIKKEKFHRNEVLKTEFHDLKRWGAEIKRSIDQSE